MPDNYPIPSGENRLGGKKMENIPSEFSDDFIELQFSHFMPPVKGVSAYSSGDSSVLPHNGLVSPKNIRNVHSPIIKSDSPHQQQQLRNVNLAPLSGQEYNTPSGSANLNDSNASLGSTSSVYYNISLPVGGMGLEDEDDDFDDIEECHDVDNPPAHSENLESVHASSNFPAVFHRTIRVDSDPSGQLSPQKFDFSNNLDSFDEIVGGKR